MNSFEILRMGLADKAEKIREESVEMETEIIDKLFLELSQVSKAVTKRELELSKTLGFIFEALCEISAIGHRNDYDWNADPEGLTLRESIIFEKIKSAIY